MVWRLSPAESSQRRRWPLWLVAVVLFGLSILVAPRTVGDEPPATATPTVADLEGLQRAFQQVVDQIAPSVVGIRTQRRRVTTIPSLGPEGQPGAVEQQVIVNGSGTVVAEDGLVLTNEHVIQGASQIDVVCFDGQRLSATLVAADPRSDLAIVHVPRAGLRPVRTCDWNTVARGQWAVVLGNPFGLGLDGQLSVSIGVIANLGRQLPGLGEVDDRFYNDMIQVNAAINPGNSGGPLFNIRGELIGIITAIHTRAAADEGVGFAIPMTPAKRRLIELLCQGRPIEYGYLGAVVRSPDAAEREGLGVGHGVVIQRVEPDGPAARAGLRTGDFILALEGQSVNGPAHLAELVGQSPVGATVRLELLRAGQPVTLRVTVDQRDVSRVSWMRGEAVHWRGMRLTDLTPDVRRQLRVPDDARGVVVIEVGADSPAGRANMQPGEVIDQVGGQPIDDTLDFLLRVRDVKGTLDVSVRHQGTRSVTP